MFYKWIKYILNLTILTKWFWFELYITLTLIKLAVTVLNEPKQTVYLQSYINLWRLLKELKFWKIELPKPPRSYSERLNVTALWCGIHKRICQSSLQPFLIGVEVYALTHPKHLASWQLQPFLSSILVRLSKICVPDHQHALQGFTLCS